MTIGPYPQLAGKPYRPSNGTEGDMFMAEWCEHCEHDSRWRDDPESAGCPILCDTMIYHTRDPEYPKEWIYDQEGRPSCTAFTQVVGSTARCNKTVDMFES